MNGRRRVVVTGLGMVTPLGNDVDTTWRRLLAGESGAGPITQFDPEDYFVQFACEVKDFDPTDYIERKQARRMDRFTHLILARGAAGGAGLGPRHRGRGGARRRGGRDRHRRPEVVPGLHRHAA